ncbi:MAG: YdcH family protein [Comamonadaceae bacterium]
MDSNLHSPERRLIDLRIEHGDLDAMIDRTSDQVPLDELLMRRLKKKRLSLRDEMARIERQLNPDEPA